MELWAEHNDSESIPDDLMEILRHYRDNPINLNDTLSESLYDLPFLSDFQIEILHAYIAQNGALASLSELYLLNGFDSVTLRLMTPFVTAGPPREINLSWKEMWQRGTHNLVSGTKTSLPRAEGFHDGSFAGDPFRFYYRYKFHYSDRITFQLSGDKDAGEQWVSPVSPYLLDYQSYYLMLNKFGRVSRAIIGKYQLQFGQGVTLWTGFAPWMSGSMPYRRYGQGIRPASAFCEYGYLRGAATSLQLNKTTSLTIFYSFVRRDATSPSTDTLELTEQQYQSLYESGYHRTELELEKKARLGEHLYGTHLQYRRTNLTLGATAYGLHFQKPLDPRELAYNYFAFSGRNSFNAGFDATWRYRRLLLFGETALSVNDNTENLYRISGWMPLAAVAGMQLHLTANHALSLALRYAAPTYQNLYSNTIGQSSNTQNESGICASLSSVLPFRIHLQASADLYRHPYLRYRVYSPSTGADLRFMLSKEVARNTILSFQYRKRYGERNSDGALYLVENTSRRQLQTSIDYKISDTWQLRSRLMWTAFDCEIPQPQKGFLVLQDISYHASLVQHPWSVTGRMALFDISGYDARIFCYENDLMYESAAPMLTGRGLRCFLIWRQQLSPSLFCSLKYGISYYPERDSVGSSHNITQGSCVHELKFQLRIKI